MLGAGGAAAPSDPKAVWLALGKTLLAVAVFVALMLVVGRRLFPWLLWQVARTGSRELFTLCVVAAAVSIAFAAASLFGVSFALGAFFAGMVLRESQFSHRAAEESLPLRDAFAVLFFVSVGMLFDPAVVWEQPFKLLMVVAIIMLGKTVAAVALVLLFRYPLNTALTVGVSLAQIGEFSFILAGLGVALELLPKEGQSLILAGALVSIAANSALFGLIIAIGETAKGKLAISNYLRNTAPQPSFPATQVIVHQPAQSSVQSEAGSGSVGWLLAGMVATLIVICVVGIMNGGATTTDVAAFSMR